MGWACRRRDGRCVGWTAGLAWTPAVRSSLSGRGRASLANPWSALWPSVCMALPHHTRTLAHHSQYPSIALSLSLDLFSSSSSSSSPSSSSSSSSSSTLTSSPSSIIPPSSITSLCIASAAPRASRPAGQLPPCCTFCTVQPWLGLPPRARPRPLNCRKVGLKSVPGGNPCSPSRITSHTRCRRPPALDLQGPTCRPSN
ncbi:hypothetical protein IWX49DRAFT_79885 [Phyllosticta citricarpa]